MPLPEGKKGETHKEFIDRCMGDATMVREFPDAGQRRAVCEGQAKTSAEGCPQELELRADGPDMAIEAAADDGGAPSLPSFTMVAYTGGPMRIAGWRYPVVVDLTGLAIPSQNSPVRFAHDAARTLGHSQSIRIDNGRLVATGIFSFAGEPDVERVVRSARHGFPWKASIGAAVEEFEFVREDQTVLVNGREFKGPVNVVRKAALGEISFVDLGADGNASASVAASAKERGIMADIEKTNGEDKAPESQTGTTATLQAQAGAGEAETAKREHEIRAEAAKAERERLRKIEAACARMEGQQVEDLRARAIAGEIAFEGLQAGLLDVLRAGRPRAPAVHDRTVRFDRSCLEAAALRAGRVSDDRIVKLCGEQALETAHRMRSLGIQQLIARAAALDGVELPVYADDPAGWLKAAFSTLSVPGILSNVANKLLLDGYSYVEDAWRRIVKIASVKDFKQHTRYRLTDDMKFQKVGPDGELKHGVLGEQSFTQQADTHGIMFSLPRQLIINDDLGAFAEIPTTLGRGAAEAIAEAVWMLLLANPNSFFSTDNKNYSSGAATALGVDSLTAAELLFLSQTKPNGRPLGIPAKLLLVPPALSVMATLLAKSLELRDTTASTKYPTANPHAGKYEPVASAYLSNATLTGASAKAWYLLADPNVLAAMEVAFLNGVDRPTVQSTDEDFNILGVRFRGFIDFGVAMQDPRAAVKIKGEA